MVNARFLMQLIEGQNSSSNSLYAKAFKKVAHMDPETWDKITPEKENAWKFELFIHNFCPSIPEG